MEQSGTSAATTASAVKSGRGGRLVRRFRRDAKGATAIEFAIVALPFFALMFAILETFLMFFASQTIETATESAARLIRTGQAQDQGLTEASFKQRICDAMNNLFNCEANLYVDVRTYTTFAAVDIAAPVDDDGELVDDFEYDAGDAGDLVVVRAFYEWPLHSNFFGLGIARLANGKHLISAVTAFVNEPF